MPKPAEIKYDEYYISYKTQLKTFYTKKKSSNLINQEYKLSDSDRLINNEKRYLSDLILNVSTSGD